MFLVEQLDSIDTQAHKLSNEHDCALYEWMVKLLSVCLRYILDLHKNGVGSSSEEHAEHDHVEAQSCDFILIAHFCNNYYIISCRFIPYLILANLSLKA